MKKTNNYGLLLLLFVWSIPLFSNAQNCTFTDPQKQAEYDALVDIYNANPNSQIRDRQEWQDLVNGVNCDVCSLPQIDRVGSGNFLFKELRVDCNASGYLTLLYIEDEGLSTIPESIGNLSSLQDLRFYSNQLSALPSSIGNLNDLDVLFLGRNNLSTLPESIGNLSSLDSLVIDENQLTTFPEIISDISSLQVLRLTDNELSTLPESIGNLSSLQDLYLGGNNLSALPTSIGDLNNLEYLILNANDLSSVPSSIGNLSNLEYLTLSGNRLSTLPSSVANLDNLLRLLLSGNRFSSIPESISDLNSLINLSIGGNQLTSIPESITNVNTLQHLGVDGNQITSLPEDIGNLSNLESLGLNANEISSLPSSIGNLSNLERLRIAQNEISCFPSEILALCSNLAPEFVPLNSNPIASQYSSFAEFCTSPTNGICGGGGDAFITGNTGNETCPSPWQDDDGDGVCNAADVCEGGDDYLDTDEDGIPNACDPFPNDKDNDATLTGNTGNETCPSPWQDDDGDGVCNAADVCEGGDDYVDTDEDGIPDACDPFPDDKEDGPTLTGNTGNETCSVWIDSDGDGICDDADICEGGDDYADADEDGVPDACDPFPNDKNFRIAQIERLVAEKEEGRKVSLMYAADQSKQPILYTIERASDAIEYEFVLSTHPRATAEIEVYYEKDTSPKLGKNYYRLRIDYQDGSSEYFISAPLYFEPTGIEAFPNPAKETLYINFKELKNMSAEIKLISLQGVELIGRRVGVNHSDIIELDLQGIQNGIYALWIKADGFKAIHQKVVITKRY